MSPVATWGTSVPTTQHNEQDGQCAYNVTFRRVLATVVAVEKWWVLHNLSVCICGLRHPACNAHAPYYHLWPTPLNNIFPHFLINGRIFEKKRVTENKMWVLILFTTFIWNISHSKKKWARYDKQCILVFTQSTLYSCPILTKLELSWQIFEKSSKFHENPFSCSMRTDGQKWRNYQSLFAILRTRLKTTKIGNFQQLTSQQYPPTLLLQIKVSPYLYLPIWISVFRVVLSKDLL